MVSPIVLIAASLVVAFLYPIVERLGRRVAVAFSMFVLFAFLALSVAQLVGTIANGPLVTDTAGFDAPLSIRLVVGPVEATALIVITAIALFGFVAVTVDARDPWHGKRVVLFFVLLLGAYGLVSTQDLFNAFVFMEIAGIAVYGLIGTAKDGRAFEAGFKYMVASGVASVFFLVGTAFIYRRVGSLSIGDIVSSAPLFAGATGALAPAFLITAIVVELKTAPANGWALDVYQAADHGLGAMISGITATAMLVILFHLFPFFAFAASGRFRPILMGIGVVAFVVPQVQAFRQESMKRMLGYSSVAQIGLVLVALAANPAPVQAGPLLIPAAIVILLNHAAAKAGLFWLAQATDDDASGAPGHLPRTLRRHPALLSIAGILVFALLAIPPFPGFFGKWSLVLALGESGTFGILVMVLVGSFLEVLYLGRWFVRVARDEGDEGDVVAARVPDDNRPEPPVVDDAFAQSIRPGDGGARVAAGAAALLLGVAGVVAAAQAGVVLTIAPVAIACAVFLGFDFIRLPGRLQTVVAIAAVAGLAAWLLPSLTGIRQLFGVIFCGGTILGLIPFFARREGRPGLLAMTVGMVAALMALVLADSLLAVFIAWELMTVTSFLLILRGRRASAAGLRYLGFSIASAMFMLAAFAIAQGSVGTSPAAASGVLAAFSTAPAGATALLAVAVLIKLGAIGFHVWLPAAYAEADDEVSSLASSVLSKAGVFVLFAATTSFAAPLVGALPLSNVIGWVGVATALVGAMAALFQEDIKYTLAYSSMSQLGYIVLSFSVLSHLGWVAALYLTVAHTLFKALLFVAIAGVVYRTGTRLMYRMGGLIKRMPLSFISVLMGIIAVSGVPPLLGFGGKWLLYTALIESGRYLEAALALFSSGIAFLYLFRLIHSIFLGQRKPEHHALREAPAAFVIPQVLLIGAIMAVSMFPNILIVPLQTIVGGTFDETIAWEGYRVISTLGYWNGNAVMYVTMGVFVVPLLWLLLVKGRVQRVEQFNIVYAAERPLAPETTHHAYNFYGHYRKAFGRLVEPWGERAWAGARGVVDTLSRTLRGWNSGNPQTYAFQILMYLLVIAVAAVGGA